MIAKEKSNAYTKDAHGDTAGFYAGLKNNFDMCWTITYAGNSSTITHTFSDVFRGNVQNMVDSIESGIAKDAGLFGGSFFDSIVLQIDEEKKDYTTTVAQNKLDFGCLKAAVNMAYGETGKGQCTKSVNVATFQLNQNYVQNLLIIKQRENVVEEKQLIDSNLKFKGFSSYSSLRYVDAPDYGSKFLEDSDTIWSVVFAMDTSVVRNKQIWLVGDPTEKTTSSYVTKAHQVSTYTTEMLLTKLFDPKFLEVIAYAGGLWFFISQMTVGLIAKKYALNSQTIELRNDTDVVEFSKIKVQDQLTEFTPIRSASHKRRTDSTVPLAVAQSPSASSERPESKTNTQDEESN